MATQSLFTSLVVENDEQFQLLVKKCLLKYKPYTFYDLLHYD